MAEESKIGLAVNTLPESSQDSQGTTSKSGSAYNHKLNKRLFSLIPIALIYMLSFAITGNTLMIFGPYAIGMALFPDKDQVENFGIKPSSCSMNTSSQEYKDSVEVQEYASVLNIYFTLAAGLPSIVSNVLFGTFSDHFGRKFLFVVPIIGSFIKNMVCAAGIYFKTSFYVLIAGFVVEGITGIYFSFLLACFAVVADVTTSDQHRSLGIAILTMSVGIGVAVGGFGASYVISATQSFLWPLLVSCGLLALCLLGVVFILPETLTVHEGDMEKGCSYICEYIKTVFSFYYRKSEHDKRRIYNLCICIFILSSITVMGRPTVETLFQINSPFCWSTVTIGWFSSVRSFAQQVLILLFIKVFQQCMEDDTIAIVGTLSAIAGFVMEGFAKTNLIIYLVPVVGAGGLLTLPMIRAIMSRMTSEDKQGAMFGGMAAVETVCYMFGSVLTNAIYARTESVIPGLVFFVLAGFCFFALIFLMILVSNRKRIEEKSYKSLAEEP